MADTTHTSCEICGKSNPKYRCPACAKRTCSLSCVKCHKLQFQCSGVRCKTKFLSLDQYTNSNLLSDYKFLEDVDRFVYTAVHDSHSKSRRQKTQILHLCRKAKQSGVNLRLMPAGMSKRKENTSMFSRKEKCMMWRIQWLFPQAGAEYVDRWVSELTVVRDILKKYIDPEQADPVHKQSLKNYCEIGPHRVCVFLRKELLPATEVRYRQLDTSQSLKDCLAHKTIIEFPTLHVVLPDKTASYISDSQDT